MKLNSPLITIIVPVYNVENTIGRCLDSLLEQTYINLEIICINDVSPDNSVKIIKEYMKKDNRVRLIEHEENKGLGPARNTGIENAKGEYLFFLDSDDYVPLVVIEKLYKALVKTNAEVAQGATQKVDMNLNPIEAPYPTTSLDKKNNLITFTSKNAYKFLIDSTWCNYIGPSAEGKLFKRTLITENKLLFPRGTIEDVPFVYELITVVKKVVLVPNLIGYYYYRGGNSITSSITVDKMLKNVRGVIRNCYSLYKINYYNKNQKALKCLQFALLDSFWNVLNYDSSSKVKNVFFTQYGYALLLKHKDILNKAMGKEWKNRIIDFSIKNNIKSLLLFKEAIKKKWSSKVLYNQLTNNVPLITIIVPVYNVENTIGRCLDSLLEQTYINLEIICINDVSPDNYVKIIKEYMKKDNRVRLIEHEENKGLGPARNTGIENAKGEYLFFLDANIYLSFNYIESLYYPIILSNSDLVSNTNQSIFDTNIVYNKKSLLKYLKYIKPKLIDKIFKREIIEKNKNIFLSATFNDLTFFITYLLHCNKVSFAVASSYFFIKKDEQFFPLESNLNKAIIYVKEFFEAFNFINKLYLFNKNIKQKKLISIYFIKMFAKAINKYKFSNKLLAQVFIQNYVLNTLLENKSFIDNNINKWLNPIKKFYEDYNLPYFNKQNTMKIYEKFKSKSLFRYIKEKLSLLLDKFLPKINYYQKKQILLCEYVPNMFNSLEKALIEAGINYDKINSQQEEKIGSPFLKKQIKNYRIIISDNLTHAFKKINHRKQVLIVTWHASGLFKKCGYYIVENYGERFGFPTYYISSSSKMEEELMLTFGISKKSIMPLGTPRTDELVNSEELKQKQFNFYHKFPHLKNKKIYLFAPTFRPEGLFLKLNFNKVARLLKDNEVVIIKQHEKTIFDSVGNREASTNINFFSEKIISMDYEAIYLLTSVCDVFITDYSSGFFDAILINKPLVFYAEDFPSYSKDRGFYFNYIDEVPGIVLLEPNEELFVNSIRTATSNHENYKNFKDKFLNACDGNSSKRLVEFIKGLNKLFVIHKG